MNELITQSEYARRRKCNVKTIYDAIIAGHITSKKVGNNVMIDPIQADIDWAKNRKSRTPPKTSEEGGDISYNKHRAIREKANAEKAVLQVAELRGTLVDRAEVVKEISSAAFTVKERLRMIPQKIAAELAAETDSHEIELILQREVDDALNSLADLKR